MPVAPHASKPRNSRRFAVTWIRQRGGSTPGLSQWRVDGDSRGLRWPTRLRVEKLPERTNLPGGWISLILAIGLMALFAYLAYRTAVTAEHPPRIADVVPTTAPTPNPEREYPPQYRGGYDENARLLGLLAIVSPLLTTIVGFYFGQHAGQASGRAAQAESEQRESEIAKFTAEAGDMPANDLLKELRSRGLVRK
jgi:hypothetical protein